MEITIGNNFVRIQIPIEDSNPPRVRIKSSLDNVIFFNEIGLKWEKSRLQEFEKFLIENRDERKVKYERDEWTHTFLYQN